MRYDRVIVGYHGCDEAVAQLLLDGNSFQSSSNAWDWLGDGIYFWEYGADRAYRFAAQSSRIREPAVVGALIQLGRCFDLLDTRFTTNLQEFYTRYVGMLASGADTELPQNRGKARYRDRAVLNMYLQAIQAEADLRYDTVRGVFIEGEPVYDDSGIHLESHIQVAVRNPGSIIGVFRPHPHIVRTKGTE